MRTSGIIFIMRQVNRVTVTLLRWFSAGFLAPETPSGKVFQSANELVAADRAAGFCTLAERLQLLRRTVFRQIPVPVTDSVAHDDGGNEIVGDIIQMRVDARPAPIIGTFA